jgi:hypothetical protein
VNHVIAELPPLDVPASKIWQQGTATDDQNRTPPNISYSHPPGLKDFLYSLGRFERLRAVAIRQVERDRGHTLFNVVPEGQLRKRVAPALQ